VPREQTILAGASHLAHLEVLRPDTTGAAMRAVAAVPAPPTAGQVPSTASTRPGPPPRLPAAAAFAIPPPGGRVPHPHGPAPLVAHGSGSDQLGRASSWSKSRSA